MNRKTLKYWFITSIILSLSCAHANETVATTSHQQIKNAGLAFLKQKASTLGLEKTEIHIGDIDNRLKLAFCRQPMQVSDNQNSRLPGNISLLVSCKQTDKPWKIYIQANVRAFKNIIIAKSTIIRGELITAKSLIFQRTDITNLNGNYLTEDRQVTGMMAKRTIQQGQIIKPYLLAKSRLIKRGEQVTILVETKGISVRMRGKALNDGTNGDRVRVMNTRSKRIVEGIAIRPGIVQIKM